MHRINQIIPHRSSLAHSTDKCVIGSAGMQADAATLHKMLDARLTWYQHQHNKTMSTPAVAQMLSTVLYYRRFFPYYTFNVVGGVDAEGWLLKDWNTVWN